MGAWLGDDVREGLGGVSRYGFHHAHRIAPGEAAAEPGTHQLVALHDVQRDRHVLQPQLATAAAYGDGMDVVAEHAHRHGVGWVRDQEDAAGEGGGLHHLAEQPAGIDDGVAHGDLVQLALVQHHFLRRGGHGHQLGDQHVVLHPFGGIEQFPQPRVLHVQRLVAGHRALHLQQLAFQQGVAFQQRAARGRDLRDVAR